MESFTITPFTEKGLHLNLTLEDSKMPVVTLKNTSESELLTNFEELLGMETPLDDEAVKSLEKIFKCMNITYILEKTSKNFETSEDQIRCIMYLYFLAFTPFEVLKRLEEKFKDQVKFMTDQEDEEPVFVYFLIGVSSAACIVGILCTSSIVYKSCKKNLYNSDEYDLEHPNINELRRLNKLN